MYQMNVVSHEVWCSKVSHRIKDAPYLCLIFGCMWFIFSYSSSTDTKRMFRWSINGCEYLSVANVIQNVFRLSSTRNVFSQIHHT